MAAATRPYFPIVRDERYRGIVNARTRAFITDEYIYRDGGFWSSCPGRNESVLSSIVGWIWRENGRRNAAPPR